MQVGSSTAAASAMTADQVRQQIGTAVAVAARDVQKAQGDAVVSMIQQAAQVQASAAPAAPGKLDVYA
jgi:hypothetical protein